MFNTFDKPEVYLALEPEVRFSGQIPAGESTGVDVPGQLWKRYHMEKLNCLIEQAIFI